MIPRILTIIYGGVVGGRSEVVITYPKSWDVMGSLQQYNFGVGTGFLTEFCLQNSGGPLRPLADRAPSSGISTGL